MYKEQKVTISCDGCGRTQTLHQSKITPCDGYTCSLGSCKLNPKFKLPETPDGYICEEIMNAAGGFAGWKFRKPTTDELQSVERAKAIRNTGIKQLANEKVKKLLDF